MQATEATTRKQAPGGVERFEYHSGAGAPSLPGWAPLETVELYAADPQPAVCNASGGAREAESRAAFDQRLAEETRKAFESGRERGRQEGGQAEREAQAKARASAEEGRARQIGELIAGIAREHERYLRAIEPEVVKLALAVAARILRREAQMDPLLLTGAVRVALGQLAGSTQVRLKVPAAELDLWTEAIALLPNLSVKPTLLAGDGMRLGDCVIETEMGSVDLGIRSQLGEIERGFFDRAGGSGSEADAPGAGRESDS